MIEPIVAYRDELARLEEERLEVQRVFHLQMPDGIDFNRPDLLEFVEHETTRIDNYRHTRTTLSNRIHYLEYMVNSYDNGIDLTYAALMYPHLRK